MLKITLDPVLSFNNQKQEFIDDPLGQGQIVLQLEHSLAAISKWESEWEVPFLELISPTTEQTISYISCMCDTGISPAVFARLKQADIDSINSYIQARKTASWIAENKKKISTNKEIVTSELIYYWMIALQIPFECDQWHLSRLLMLIRVCNEKNKVDDKKKNLTQDDLAARREENARRRKEFNTQG